MKTRADNSSRAMAIVREARKHEGKAEATGNNDGDFVVEVLNPPGTKNPDPREAGKSWCAAFVLKCVHDAGLKMPGLYWKNRAVWHLQMQMQKAGLRTDKAQPGVAVVSTRSEGAYDEKSGLLLPRQPGHIGIIEEVRDHAVVCIEGNVANKVSRVVRSWPCGEVIALYDLAQLNYRS